MTRRSAGGLCGVERKLSGINRELKEMGPQADEGGEQVLITDGVHTENTEENGGPQADDGGEQQLSKIGQQLKGNY